MKAVKIALISILALLLLLVVGVVVLSFPGVQRAVVTRMVATEPGESVEMEYLHVGFSRTEARDVHLTQADGAVYRVAEVSADLSLLQLIFRNRARVDDLVVTGVLVDLSEAEPKDDREPFRGILRQMELPVELYLDEVRVAGQLLLPGSADEPWVGDFVVTGGDFAPGREGHLRLDGDVQAPGSAALFSALGIEGDLTVTQGERGRIEQARLLASISAAGLRPEAAETLNAEVLLLTTEEGESYQARFHRVQADMNEEAEPPTLVVLDAAYSYDEGLLEGRWAVDVDREQLAAFVGETELPAFTANGSGQFSYGLDGEKLDLDGNLDVSIPDLGPIAEELRELGGFTFSSRFDLAMDEDAFQLEELVVELRDQEERNLLTVRNFQPFRYDRQEERLEGAAERMDLAEVTIGALPVEWVNLFAGAGEDEMRLLGGDLTGQLLVSAEGGGVFFRLTEPVRAEGISVTSGGDPLLSAVSLEAHGSGSFVDGRLEATLDPFRLLDQQTEILTASGTYDSATGQVRAELQGSLPVVMNRLAVIESHDLGAGLFEMELSLNSGEPFQVELTGAARNLTSRTQRKSLPDVVFEGSVRESDENVWELDVPVRLEGVDTSDIRLAGTWSMGEERSEFELDLAGEQLVVEDMTALASAFSGPEGDGAPSEAPAPANERDEEPLWVGVEGILRVDIASIELQQDHGLRELRGNLTVTADSIVNSLEATFMDSPVELGASLRFVEAEERPYVLEGSIEAPEFAAADLFRQLQPNRPPTVEGLFVVSMDIHGNGRNLQDLLGRVRGQARLNSDGGIIRLLYTDNPLAGLGMAAGVLLGTLGGEAGTISEISRMLSNMPYDQMSILAERDEELDFNLKEFTVLSPELHLRGTGEVRHREGLAILEQPMEITLRLGAKGALAEALASAEVLGQETDDLGYRQMRRDFPITGTPANPNASAFYGMLVDALLRFVVPGSEDEDGGAVPQIPELFEGILRGVRGK